MKRICTLLCTMLVLTTSAQEVKVTASMKKAMQAIDTQRIRAHIAYLSDDKLLGRAPGKPGYDMAGDYVIGQFTALGLQPAGDAGDFRQRFTLRRSTLNRSSVKLWLTDKEGNIDTLTSRTDFSIAPHPVKPNVSIANASLVFAGYGVDLPGHNDYAAIDVKGKIVVVLRDVPRGLDPIYSVHFSNLGYKTELARQKGAIGLIVAASTAVPATMFSSNAPVSNTINTERTKAYGTRFNGNVDVLINTSFNFLNHLFMQSGHNLSEVMKQLAMGKPQSFSLPNILNVRYETTYSDVETYNVVGMIPGSDPELKKEYVIHTAHLDHVGVGRPVNGDSIYNGAHDNASGVASLLEIARLYRTAGVKPKRSILITMVSAEESGLLGSAYFASNPTVPRSAIVANVNTDMPVIVAPCLSVIPLGAQYSSMMKHVEFATSALGLSIEADAEPQENFFIRSDQYSFIKEHIPALHIKTGRKTDVPGFDLSAYVRAWRAKYYHQPQDQLEGGLFHFGSAKTYIQVNFLTSYSVAMTRERPSWNPGVLF